MFSVMKMSSQSLPNHSSAFISDIEQNVFKISLHALTEVYYTYQQYFQVYKWVQKSETTLKI